MMDMPQVSEPEVVVFQGMLGSHSHAVACELFPDYAYVEAITFRDAIEYVAAGLANKAIIPVQNSIAGRVFDVHMILSQSRVFITAEYIHRVQHCLIGHVSSSMSDIKTITSHPMALAQCNKFLQAHYDRMSRGTDGNGEKQATSVIPVSDTAQAAKDVAASQDRSIAAIAPEKCIEIYSNLKILSQSVQDDLDNYTRFFIVERISSIGDAAKEISSKKSKGIITCLFFRTKNVPSALMLCLAVFSARSINILNIESFVPFSGMNENGAEFFVEVEGHFRNRGLQKTIDDLSTFASEIRVVGCFIRSRFREK